MPPRPSGTGAIGPVVNWAPRKQQGLQDGTPFDAQLKEAIRLSLAEAHRRVAIPPDDGRRKAEAEEIEATIRDSEKLAAILRQLPGVDPRHPNFTKYLETWH